MISVIYSHMIIRQIFIGITLYCLFRLPTYFIKQPHFHYAFPNNRFVMRFGQQVYVPSINIIDKILCALLGLSLVFNQPVWPNTNYWTSTTLLVPPSTCRAYHRITQILLLSIFYKHSGLIFLCFWCSKILTNYIYNWNSVCQSVACRCQF